MDDVRPVCARFHHAIELIGARWTGAVLRGLFAGHRQFSQLRASVPGISDAMLTQRLRTLETEGLVTRAVTASSPVRVEYTLTEKGRALEPVLEAVIAWSHRWVPIPGEAAAEE
ncbi:winged helix-turn-helix transcriptional regulator [Streptomyces albidoflavus]|jgi:DNA-binding HxlR family transcriptional regulator|uniref:Transcriptional regulator n=2 Tax=Streptomyces TaxID=1883 RepID=D6AY54_9ACTN|nr:MULTISPECIES: helix-turn-helix domain-containing protein [Streptomyces]MYW59277.1 transcriptional regulator [Streptomyces sp. SID8370]MYW87087.1 transcriptional regulator [Streptomyces sp. SID8371]MYX52133.1 transcriptional regulator [Streptomyces sp. SID8385]MYX82593.1 transcriptional regulator [Streptomyces sp. SID4915]NUW06201.1 helix-turn-helix transcriptional regulator [Streptomyces sp. CAI-21]NVI30811.1 helix-turn-helix transcriptional regulator [Streptomyces sp. CAI-17]BDH53695.1 t